MAKVALKDMTSSELERVRAQAETDLALASRYPHSTFIDKAPALRMRLDLIAKESHYRVLMKLQKRTR